MDRQINVHIEGDTARLPVADFRALLNPREQRALEAFEARCGVFGATERRAAPMTVDKTGNNGDVPATTSAATLPCLTGAALTLAASTRSWTPGRSTRSLTAIRSSI
jgi:hypothetical protein